MTTFTSTQDYDFLLKTLSQGSIIFKSQSLKRLLSLAINDKKQFNFITKLVLNQIQNLYDQDKQDINLNSILILSEIIGMNGQNTIINSNFGGNNINVNKQYEHIFLNKGHIQKVIKNLGHPTKPNIRKASHTCLLTYLKNFKNFNHLANAYSKYGLDNDNPLVRQKAINSFQSILILQLKLFNWSSEQTKRLFSNFIRKAQDQNQLVIKAAAQCLISMCKIQQINILANKLQTQTLVNFKQFLQKAIQTLNPGSLKIQPDDIEKLIKERQDIHKEPQMQTITIKENQIKQKSHKEPLVIQIQLPIQKNFQNVKPKTNMNSNTQRRLDKIRNSILKNQNRKNQSTSMIEKDTKLFGNIITQGSIKERTESAQELLFKIQSNKDKPQFPQSIRQILPNVIKMLKDTNPKLVGTTLRILQLIIEYINPNDKSFIPLLSLIVQKLGDQKISIRQSVSKVIKELISLFDQKKTKKDIWIVQLIQNMKKNTNTYLRDETLGLILYIFQETPKQEIDCDYQRLLQSIVVYADDSKTKIKIRTLDCLAQIIVVSGQIEKHCENIKKKMSAIFYQMLLEKVLRLQKQRKIKQQQLQKVRQIQRQKQKQKQLQKHKSPFYSQKDSLHTIQTKQFSTTSRTAYHQIPNISGEYIHQRNQSQGDQITKVNHSMDIIRKRPTYIRNLRKSSGIGVGLGTTRNTQNDSYSVSHKNIQKSLDRTIDDNMQVVLPSLYTKRNHLNNKFLNQKKPTEFTPNKTIDHSAAGINKSYVKNQPTSQYLTKQELTPLKQPEKECKQILNDLKSSDWKILFQTVNKLRRLVQFNVEVISNLPQNLIHNLVLDILALVDNLRSSVAKNALIGLNQLIIALNRQIDCEMEMIFDKVIKKSADTNVFISSEVQKVMNCLCVQFSTTKILDKIQSFKDNKSIPIKQTCVNSLLIIKAQLKIQEKQQLKLIQSFSYFLFDSNQEVRSKSRNGLIELCQGLGDWYRILRGKINSGLFKSICEIMTKSSNIGKDKDNSINNINSNERYSTISNSPKKVLNSTKDDYHTIKIQNTKQNSVKQIQKSQSPLIRRKIQKISNFPVQFQSIQSYLQQCNASDWKKRIEFINKIQQLAVQFPEQFIQYRSAHHFVDTLCKQILEPNLKVSLNALGVFQKIFQPLKGLIQNNISMICNSLFATINSGKQQIKQKGEELSHLLIDQTDPQVILQYLTHGVLYSLPKSRIFLAIKLKQKLSDLFSSKKQLLFKFIFPLMNKLMQEYKSELIPYMIGIFNKLYQLIGNQMFNHLTKFKQVKQMIQK